MTQHPTARRGRRTTQVDLSVQSGWNNNFTSRDEVAAVPRIAVVGFSHETNTYSQELFTLDKVVTGHRGQALIDAQTGSKSTIGGFVTDPPAGVEIVPIVDARGVPSGPMPASDFAEQLDLTSELLAAAGPVDGVLLSIHGAMVTESTFDGDAEIARRVRSVVGPDVPIGAVADMHANFDQPLIDQLDLMFPFQTNPHVDARERAIECREALLEIIATGRRPAMALELIPLVVTITKQDTRTEPMRGLLDLALELEQRDGVVDVSILEGFPYADVPFLGMSVVVTHRDGKPAAETIAKEMAAAVWQAREALQGDGLPVPDAVRAAAASDKQPVLLLDVGDNIGGGSPADSTVLVAELISQQVKGSVAILHDRLAVEELGEVAIGDRVDIAAGAKRVEAAGEPVRLEGVVSGIGDGVYSEPKIAHGGTKDFNAGRTIAITTDAGPTVLLISKRVQPTSSHQLINVGIDPTSLTVIAAKGVNGPRAGFGEICGEFIEADTPGITRSSVLGFDYQNRRRPMYPYEPETVYP